MFTDVCMYKNVLSYSVKSSIFEEFIFVGSHRWIFHSAVRGNVISSSTRDSEKETSFVLDESVSSEISRHGSSSAL